MKKSNRKGLLSGRFQKEGAGLPAPSRGFKRFIYILYTHFYKFVTLNALTLLFSLPLITAPAAVCAADRVYVLLIKNGNCFLWHDFTKEFKEDVWKMLPPGLLFALMLFAGYFFMSLGKGNASYPFRSMLLWLLGILLTVAGLSWGRYTFALTTVQALPVTVLMKNAILLCLVKPLRAAAVTALILLSLFAAAALFPLSVFVLAAVGVALVQYSTCFIVFDLAEKYALRREE